MRKFGFGLVVCALAGLCAAEWTPLGTLQIASRENLAARMQPVAAKMNFPMLPVVVEAAFQQIELTKAVGTPAKKSDWGVCFFVDLPKLKKLSESAKEEDIGEAMGVVTVCPIAKDKSAWQQKHPELKPEADGVFVVNRKVSDDIPAEAVPEEMKKGWKEYVCFSPDGKTAFISQDRALVRQTAKTNSAFAAPLEKGFLSFETTANSSAFAEAVSILCAEAVREAAKETKKEKKKNDDGDSDEFSLIPNDFGDKTLPPLVQALVQQCAGMRVTMGASQVGFDLRVRLTPKPGSELAAPSRALPAKALEFKGLPENTVFALASTTPSLVPNGAFDKLVRAFFAEVLKNFERHFADAIAKAEKEPKDKQDPQFTSTLKSFAYLVRAAESLRTGTGTCGWLFCTAADDGKEHTRFACAFEGLSQPLAFSEKAPAKVAGVETRVTTTPNRYLCEIVGKDFKPGKKNLDGCFAKIVPECAQTKTPLFACYNRIALGVAEDQPPAMVSVGTFAWRKDDSYRFLVRMPFTDLLPLMAGLIQVQTEEE